MSSRTWFKINCERWFSGSIRKESMEEIMVPGAVALRSIWTDVLALAGRTGTDGFIRLPGTEIGYTDEQLSKIFHVPIELWVYVKDRLVDHPDGEEENRIIVHPGNVIEIINWPLYQSEYSRQKSYRNKLHGKVTTESAGRERGRGRRRKEEKKDLPLKPSRPKSAPSDLAKGLASVLADWILESNPGNRELREDRREKTVEAWALEIDRMIRIDKRDPTEIRKVIDWSQQDDFWKLNILSAKKLRAQFDQLIVKLNARGKEDGDITRGYEFLRGKAK